MSYEKVIAKIIAVEDGRPQRCTSPLRAFRRHDALQLLEDVILQEIFVLSFGGACIHENLRTSPLNELDCCSGCLACGLHSCWPLPLPLPLPLRHMPLEN